MRRPEIEMAEQALRTLGKEGLLYTYHQDVHACPGAYLRLAEFFVQFAKEYWAPTPAKEKKK